ncbi:MAG TPA: DUF4832 domain-containing protein [Bacteroidia bacterium]|nr:DUF4832 domain-containing protein [Bacteroidia bacterium]
MTGIVLWDTSDRRDTDAIQLEYSYIGYGRVVKPDGNFDWTLVEEKLDGIASRGHQAIFRFYLVYPGSPTETPEFIRALPDYTEITGTSEGKETGFPDWSHPALRQFVLDFHEEFARRYDADPRLAFVQVGFGLWAEYHIYDGPFELGKTFPDHAYQAEFFKHLSQCYRQTTWSISVDAGKKKVSPFADSPELLELPFGVFDDSFLHERHAKSNERDWNAIGRDRTLRQPGGGEFSYYTDHDQKHALSPKGPHGESFEAAAARFGITYMIGDGQPKYQSLDRIKEAGMACGYRFRVVGFESGKGRSRVTVRNDGIAPIYRDAWVAVDGVRAKGSLKGLAPGAVTVFEIGVGGDAPTLTIECDHLVAGQRIGYEAELE